jgi:bifunctional non-homologous end joining protein LigD
LRECRTPPEGREWRYELKLDGFGAVGRKSGRSAQLWSRNQKVFTRRFQVWRRGSGNCPPIPSIIDGKIVALELPAGPSFNLLQGFGSGAPLIVLYALDLLMLRGKDVRLWPLERSEQLHTIVQNVADPIRYSETFNVPVSNLMRAVRGQQLEGIVAKRAGSQYRSGERSNDWVKWRANRGQEFVIGGYVPNGDRLDSILVGYYEGRDLIYAAAVRAGISSEFRRVLLPHFDELRMPRCPFANLPDRGEKALGRGSHGGKDGLCRWLHPFLVVRTEFLEWTRTTDCVILDSPRFAAIRMRGT